MSRPSASAFFFLVLAGLAPPFQSERARAQPANPMSIPCPPAPLVLSSVAIPGDVDLGGGLTYQFIRCESSECSSPGKPGCERQPFLCVPGSWEKREIAQDFQNENRKLLFLDTETEQGGDDKNPTDGPEQANLVFYGGHGAPGRISSRGANKSVRLDEMSLGDCQARYWWMLSCNVMAHGPSLSTPNRKSVDFLAPEQFDGDPNNVFREWGKTAGARKPLHPNIRMACGGSTELGGYFSFPTASIWHYKLMGQLPVADSFLLGLTRFYHVPLCVTRGNEEREKTPLYDQEFSRDPNPAPEGDHLFIQYPVHLKEPFLPLANAVSERFGSAGPHPPSDDAQGPPPRRFPVLKVSRTPFPEWLEKEVERLPVLPYGYRGGGADRLFPPVAFLEQVLPPWWGERLRMKDVCVKVQPRSGAVTVAWIPSNLVATPALREHLLSGEDLFALVNQWGVGPNQWIGPAKGARTVKQLRPEIEILQMNVDGAKTSEALKPEFSRKNIDRHTKCIYVRLSAWIEVEGQPTRVFGEGSEWLLGGCPRSGSVEEEAPLPPGDNVCRSKIPSQFTLSWVGREVSDETAYSLVSSDTLVSVRVARREAWRRLGENRREYQEPTLRWGYKAAPVHCTQSRMYLVYLFDFLPKDQYTGNLPITVEIPAHQLPEGKKIEDDWICDPEVPKAESEPEG